MQIAGLHIGIWGGFLGFVLLMLALDLGVFHRESHAVQMKEALIWSAVWIGLALVFNLGLYYFWDTIRPGSTMPNDEAAMAFFAGYLIEKALSVDNIFVFLMVFTYFQVPAELKHRVLFYGIIGALVFRAIFIALGAELLARYHWVIFIFGGFLILTAIKMWFMHGKEVDPEKNPLIRLFRKFVPVTSEYHGQKFFVRQNGKLWATPLFITLLFIEFTDVIFAVDSIPAIFAITTEPFIVFTSNVFAILGLRALFFAISGLVEQVRYLSHGLSLILLFVGGKMIYSYWGKFPIGWSLLIIVTILVGSILASRFIQPKALARGGEEEANA